MPLRLREVVCCLAAVHGRLRTVILGLVDPSLTLVECRSAVVRFRRTKMLLGSSLMGLQRTIVSLLGLGGSIGRSFGRATPAVTEVLNARAQLRGALRSLSCPRRSGVAGTFQYHQRSLFPCPCAGTRLCRW